jgi:hypothetical protein
MPLHLVRRRPVAFHFLDASLRSAALASVALLVLAGGEAFAAQGDCGTPVSSTEPKTSDCLFVLKAGVGTVECALCTCDVNSSGSVTASDALLCLRKAVGQDVVLDCPDCAAPVGCPGVVEWTTLAGTGDTCTTNAECTPGICDPAIDRCRTQTEIDLGWTGTAHDVDQDAGATLRLLVDCEGTVDGCGECAISGIDASRGNCRCANDTRTLCDSPFESDAGQCPACSGGALDGADCASNGDCDAGSCAKHCAFDPEIACSTNSDCPTGAKPCDNELRCGDGDGATCTGDADCSGTCTGASACRCFDGAPTPVASVEFPFCVVPVLSADVTGTIDVDSGAAVLDKSLALLAYDGISLVSPCPICGGSCSNAPATACVEDEDCPGGSCTDDPTGNDGQRGGSCIGGASDGDSCDVHATNASFPAAGAGYSLDCMPEADENFTGSGLAIRIVETTGTVSLASTLPCDPEASSSELCPCLVCSGHPEVACHSDADCAAVRSCSLRPEQACTANGDCLDIDLGTCTAFGNTRCNGAPTRECDSNSDCESVDFGICDVAPCDSSGGAVSPEPNACAGFLCEDDGNGEGTCTNGPDDRFCDGLLTADGGGIRQCTSNIDCSIERLGFDAGVCTLVQPRDCFLPTIDATGMPSTVSPVTVAAFCAPLAERIGSNQSIGLPGPGRIRRQAMTRALCASDDSVVYIPDIDVCPAD